MVFELLTAFSKSFALNPIVAGGTCIITVDVTSNAAGNYVNITGDLTSSAGSYGTATDTLIVNSSPLSASVPTLSEWGTIIFALLLAITAVLFLNRSHA